jgi:hypothetical protein
MDIIQPCRQTRGCSWDGGECVFFDINSRQCNLFEVLDWPKAMACRDLRMCECNYTAREMCDKLGVKVEYFDPKYKAVLESNLVFE